MYSHWMVISPTLSQKKALLNTALWLSKLISPERTLIIKRSLNDTDDFEAGEICMNLALKNLFKKRFLFLSEKHSFTGGAVQTIKGEFPELPLKLLLLDVHLDVFNTQKSIPEEKRASEIHEGNFLAYLLKNNILKEEEIFLISTNSPANLELPAGYYYLSWDIDYGLSRFARYPFPQNQDFRKVEFYLKILFREFLKRDKMVIAMDIVELDYRKVAVPLQVACLISRFVNYFFLSCR